MNVFTEIWNEISPQLNWVLILGIIALGEITKRLWVSEKPKASWKVLFVTLPATILYVVFSKVAYLQSGVSFLTAFWLYAFFVKGVLNIFNMRNYASKKSDLIGGRPDDR
jgi:hypothetical protein